MPEIQNIEVAFSELSNALARISVTQLSDNLKALSTAPSLEEDSFFEPPDFELSAAETIDKIDLDLDTSNTSELDSQLARAQDAVYGLIDSIQSLDETSSFVGEVTEAIVASSDMLAEQIGASLDAVASKYSDDLAAALEEQREILIEGILGGAGEQLEEAVAELEAALDIGADDAAGIIESSVLDVDRLFDNAMEELGAQLGDRLRDESTNVVEELAASTLTELVNDMTLTQISASLSNAMSPMLPQLAAARTMVSAVKKALELLRSGV